MPPVKPRTPKAEEKALAASPAPTPARARDDKAVMKRQMLILLVVFAAAALVWGVWSIGQDRGWGNADRAVKSKLDAAQQAFVERRLDKAVKNYRTVLDRYPQHPLAVQALTSLATAYEEQGQIDKAVTAYGELLAKLGDDPAKADLRAFTGLQMAKLQQEKGAYDQALQGFEKVRADFPNTDWSGEAQAGIGRVWQARKEYKKGIEAFEKVIKELPKGFLAAEAQGNIGECLEAMGQDDKAIKAYQKVLDDYPSAVWDQAKARIQALREKKAMGKAKASQATARAAKVQ